MREKMQDNIYRNIFITGDYHFGDPRIDILGRPFDSPMKMFSTIKKNHNAVVKEDDLVIVNGDVCYKNSPDHLYLVSELNGKKILIRGNHDRVFSDNDLKPYFIDIIEDGGGYEFQVMDINCYITHYPTRGRKDRFNITAHVHNAWKYQLNMFNCGVDVNHFLPVNILTIPKHLEAICDYYDFDVWCAYNEINTQYIGKRGKFGSYFKD